jgi:hypothetical protein
LGRRKADALGTEKSGVKVADERERAGFIDATILSYPGQGMAKKEREAASRLRKPRRRFVIFR